MRCAILMLGFGSVLALADSHIAPRKNPVILDCGARESWNCEVERSLTVRLSPNWNSSLLLSAGGEDIQLQIVRATRATLRRESEPRPGVFLPATLSGTGLFGNQSQVSPLDQYQELVMTVVRKLLLSDHPWHKKLSARCRNNSGAPGCEPR